MKAMHSVWAGLGLVAVALGGIAAAQTPDKAVLERGRYIVATSGCNDCHTPGYPEGGGNVPVSQWLTGSNVGFSGPWGTTYPANLRLRMQELSEQDWIRAARTPRRPPMPWFSLRDMSDQDLKAMYQFVRSLGPAGVPAPGYAPPGQAVTTPYFEFVPKNLAHQAKR